MTIGHPIHPRDQILEDLRAVIPEARTSGDLWLIPESEGYRVEDGFCAGCEQMIPKDPTSALCPYCIRKGK